MKSNDLNKYAITHFIMHIVLVLSVISSILSLASTLGTRGRVYLSASLLHSTCNLFDFFIDSHASLPWKLADSGKREWNNCK
jgi:uncharacterized membrane protein YwaF